MRIKLCAIAKNEGPYLADWVFHHLAFGFDGIEVWVNDTEDSTVEILDRLRAVEPRVQYRVVDRLLHRSLAEGKNFQFRAYRRLANKSRKEGFSHAFFLDLDEYWMPRDFTSPVTDFVPGPDVSVTSFLWALEVPSEQAQPYAPPLSEDVLALQLNPHVKSVVRLDDRVRQYRTHTARTSGERMLVREPFPLDDARAQQWGSVVPAEFLRARQDRLPEAFIYHRIFRSPLEFTAAIGNGLRQTGRNMPLKTNRRGFLPNEYARIDFRIPSGLRRDYVRARRAFEARTGVREWAEASIASSIERAERVRDQLLGRPELMAELREVVRGLPEPALDARYPLWDRFVRGRTEHVTCRDDGGAELAGRVFTDVHGEVELGLELPQEVHPLDTISVAAGPDGTAFRTAVPPAVRRQVPAGEVSVRARFRGAYFWDALPVVP